MPKPIKAKINLSKVNKELLFKGEKGTYLDLVIWPNKGGKGQYGDTHVIHQGISKEARDSGQKEQIIGSLTMPDDSAPHRQQTKPASNSTDW